MEVSAKPIRFMTRLSRVISGPWRAHPLCRRRASPPNNPPHSHWNHPPNKQLPLATDAAKIVPWRSPPAPPSTEPSSSPPSPTTDAASSRSPETPSSSSKPSSTTAPRALYKIHAFVVMPDHIHLLLTPQDIVLERAMQLIKGGFSHRLASPRISPSGSAVSSTTHPRCRRLQDPPQLYPPEPRPRPPCHTQASVG